MCSQKVNGKRVEEHFSYGKFLTPTVPKRCWFALLEDAFNPQPKSRASSGWRVMSDSEGEDWGC